MAVVIASDLHGSALWTRRLLDMCEAEKASQLVLLGDLLYHGPRNPLPDEYDPPAVVEMLNAWASRIIAVRGNCDSEVDSMVLKFPLVELAALVLDGRRFLCTHGHIFNADNRLPMDDGDILLFGHSHLYLCEKRENVFVINPGSVSLAKEERPNSYMVYKNGTCQIKDFIGNILTSISFP